MVVLREGILEIHHGGFSPIKRHLERKVNVSESGSV
jgi:hypothetical protein